MDPRLWGVATGAALFLAAAKAHGRQLRVERELHGYLEIDFRGGSNPPWVEALWRRDRIRFWIVFPLLSAILVAAARAWWSAPTVAVVVAALVAGSAAAFTALGLASLARFRRKGDLRTKARRERPGWLSSADRGGWSWWILVAALWSLSGLSIRFYS
ncbi:MAG: hypothetical protein ACT4PT_04500 [Methanobacteriota archaeon]